MEALLAWGLVDVLRQHHPEGGLYSWWDYRRLAFSKNDGLRLDYILATKPLAAQSTTVQIDRQERKGGGADKPSDHAPVVFRFDELTSMTPLESTVIVPVTFSSQLFMIRVCVPDGPPIVRPRIVGFMSRLTT